MINKILTILFCLSAIQTANSQSSFGLHIGLATPSEKVNQVYNTDLITASNLTGILMREAASSGYMLSAKLRQSIDQQFWFTGGISLARFPESTIPIVNQANPLDTLVTISTVQNVVPIHAGLLYQFNRGLVSFYVVGDLTYNYLMNSVDVVTKNNQTFPLPPEDETVTRIGYGIGAGLDVNLKIVTANIEAKMNTINFIGKESNENNKSYFSLTLGVYFGDTQIEKRASN